MVRVSTSDFRVGLRIEIDGQPYLILQNDFVKPGKGQAFNRIKVKNFLTGRVIEKTFKSGESVETADVREQQMRFLYSDQEGATFMDDETFDQEVIFWDKIENIRPWLLEDTIYTLVLYNGNVIAVEPPIFMELTITETVPGVRGDTASGRVLKPAVTNTGAKVMVPIFIEEGEVVRIDTRTGSYDSRVSK
ncbi:Elongation factor P [Chlamydia avium]|uniref:Elongation factor P n=2 Tax=Chlamydia avium TaxID=1457141 RepID=W8JRM8_9CHLA|nr:elongation factor P [Chlamydia avium]AHK63503.1 Elongation factor P 2 [Chlamydia avium 10DC88]EPP37035.1 translation elongation factor P [Chlamydia psittaci 10_743_SC13]EPP38466.1 translation elongation factor P [Chlamydia avium]VVT43096.1 Elongation factor P [Chlamydia avium]